MAAFVLGVLYLYFSLTAVELLVRVYDDDKAATLKKEQWHLRTRLSHKQAVVAFLTILR